MRRIRPHFRGPDEYNLRTTRECSISNMRSTLTVLVTALLLLQFARSQVTNNFQGVTFGEYRCDLPLGSKVWLDGNRQMETLDQLRWIFQFHSRWLETGGASGARANLSNADLCSVDLHGTNLGGVNFEHANLAKANLQGCNFSGSNLSSANLTEADLRYSTFSGTDLHSAVFAKADLRWTKFDSSNLESAGFLDTDASGSQLWQTSLAHAYIHGAELSASTLFLVNMDGVDFEPKSLPVIRGISTSPNLQTMTYLTSQDALVQLRKQFEDNGFLTQERQTTYAIRHTQSDAKRIIALRETRACTSLKWLLQLDEVSAQKDAVTNPSCSYGQVILDWIDYRFDQVFDWTCRYGMRPNRCLKLLGGGILVFGFAYFVFMQLSPRFVTGIYRISGENEGNKTRNVVKTKITLSPRSSKNSNLHSRWLIILRDEPRLIYYAFFFSLMSAFNIGFRDINFGRWLRLITVTEYDLKAEGWARPLSGLQALFSLAMFALWFLTYFGRPFAS